MAGHNCRRCGERHHHIVGQEDTHLCRDLRQRLDRQTKAVNLIKGLLVEHFARGTDYETVALDIVKALAGRDLGV